MADIREFIIFDPRTLRLGKGSAFTQRLAKVRMVLRRLVVRSTKIPGARTIYLAVYRFHIWIAVRLAASFTGTRAVYVTGGCGRGEIKPGISDIDLVVIGDWPEPVQIRLIKVLAVAIVLMPLFDRESIGAIQTWDDLVHFNDTDLFIAYQYASAKKNWTLVWGEDRMQQLPDLSSERRVAASYLSLVNWWGMFARMAFGQSITARDKVFQNSLSFKAVADVLRAEVMADTGIPPRRRTDILRGGLSGEDDALLAKLLATDAAGFQTAEANLQEESGAWLLKNIPRVIAKFSQRQALESIAAPEVSGNLSDLIVSPETRRHIDAVVTKAAALPGFASAALTPCVLFLTPDSLALFLRFAPDTQPSIAQLRELIADHLNTVEELPERVCVYLLAERAAFLLDFIFGLEFWSLLLTPEVNPDVFLLLQQPEAMLRGSTISFAGEVRWSHVSQALLEEEIMVRRKAHGRLGFGSRPNPLDNLRNFWRLLQQEVMRTRTDNRVLLPVTLPAIADAVRQMHPECSDDLVFLQEAFSTAKRGAETMGLLDAMQRVSLVLAA